MDDARKRVEQFNTEQRIAELEAEIRRLRKTLPDRLQAMVDQAEADGLYEALDVTLEQVRIVELEELLAEEREAADAQRRETAAILRHKRAMAWQLEQARKILKLVQEGKMATVTEAEIDRIFADLDDAPDDKADR